MVLIKKKLILIFFVGAMRRKRAGGDGFQPLNTKEENIDVFDVNFNDDELWFFLKIWRFIFVYIF